MLYYVYILRCHDNSLYTGITNNIEKRMFAHIHKLKEAASYTKSRGVKSLEIILEAKNRSEASKLEYHIKSLTKIKKEVIIQNQKDYDGFKCIEIKEEYFVKIQKEGQ